MDITIDYLFNRASTLINQSIFLLVGVAVMVFFWGIIQYVLAQGDEKKIAAGRAYILYGLIGLAIIVSVWGLVNLIVFTIFGDTGSDPLNFRIPRL